MNTVSLDKVSSYTSTMFGLKTYLSKVESTVNHYILLFYSSTTVSMVMLDKNLGMTMTVPIINLVGCVNSTIAKD
jgi:hypothetical protein